MPAIEITHEKSPVFYDRYTRKSDLQQQTHYCPGCGHGVVHKLIAEAVADMGLQDRAIFVSPVGCSVFAYFYFDMGNVQAAHGRTPAAATALKRANPESLVIAYQGDGDLAAIGTAEIIHAANRGENFTVFFVNNAIYGMTGGQMAPTTLVGQKSTTTPWGRRPSNEGYPLHMCELLATLDAPVYIERVSLHDNKNIMRARRAVRKALEIQKTSGGFSFVEFLSPCPTIWKMTPLESRKWVEEKMLPVFPVSCFRDRKQLNSENHGPEVLPVEEVLGLGNPSMCSATTDALSGGLTIPVTVKIAGFGGQGVLLLGQILAEMGLRQGLEVSWLPSYGPEMRSGSAHCHVCLSPEKIGSPLVEHPDVLIAMNEISLRKFANSVRSDGLILYNAEGPPAGFSSPVSRLICIPASDIADKLGAAKVANVVMLGALLRLSDEFPREAAEAVLEAMIRNPALRDANHRAIEAGAECVAVTAV